MKLKKRKKMWSLNSLLVFLFFFESHCQDPITLRLSKLEKRVKALEKENHVLRVTAGSYAEYCKLLPDDICGACQCKDDDRLLDKYYCDCQNLQAKRDCREFYQYGIKINGIYKVHQNILKIIQVYCDQKTDGGGWTVIQRRVDGSINFFRDWTNYKNGFGQLQNEFWLGNENIFTMSLQGLYPRGNELRIDMKNSVGIYKYAKYKQFQLVNENLQYMLHIDKHSGTANNGFKPHSQLKFSTFDSDNDKYKDNCASIYKSGWWFSACFYTNLNGVYHYGGKVSSRASGIHWSTAGSFNNHDESLLFVEMKMRRNL